ncbi:MAG: hypothetical protein Q9210_004874 [Variospora velana]
MGYILCFMDPTILIIFPIVMMSMLFLIILPSPSESSAGEGETETLGNHHLERLKLFQFVTARVQDRLYWACVVCQVLSNLVFQFVSDKVDAVLGRHGPGGMTREVDENPPWKLILILGRKKTGDRKQDYTFALKTVKATSRFINDMKAFVAQQWGRLIMFLRIMTRITLSWVFGLSNDTTASIAHQLGCLVLVSGIMIRIAQNLIYGMLIVSKVALTLLFHHSRVGYEDGESMSARPPRNQLDASSKQKSQHDTECDVGNSVICQLTLMLAGRKRGEYRKHYTQALTMTKIVFRVDRQTVRSQDDEKVDGDKPTEENILDSQTRSFLEQVLDCLSMCTVHLGSWIGERLPFSCIMAIQGPMGTTQHVAGLDTGASENLISRRSALASGLSLEAYDGPVLDAVGTEIRPIGRVTFEWCVSNFDTKLYTTTFAVLDDGHCKDFNILLGKEEIDKLGFYIRNRAVFFCSKRIEQPLFVKKS